MYQIVPSAQSLRGIFALFLLVTGLIAIIVDRVRLRQWRRAIKAYRARADYHLTQQYRRAR